MMITMTSEPLRHLKKQVQGTVLTPDHAGYDQIRRGWNLSIDQRPALILVATSAPDVEAGVQFAREEGYGVAVQSTGHGILHPNDLFHFSFNIPLGEAVHAQQSRVCPPGVSTPG